LQVEELNVLNSYYLVTLKTRKLTPATEAFRKMLSKTRLFSFSENLRKNPQQQTSRVR